jgi:hypothetical protein
MTPEEHARELLKHIVGEARVDEFPAAVVAIASYVQVIEDGALQRARTALHAHKTPTLARREAARIVRQQMWSDGYKPQEEAQSD